MTRYEYLQNQIDSITDMQRAMRNQFGKQEGMKLLEGVKNNIKNKQLNLTMENGMKKAGMVYRIFN